MMHERVKSISLGDENFFRYPTPRPNPTRTRTRTPTPNPNPNPTPSLTLTLASSAPLSRACSWSSSC